MFTAPATAKQPFKNTEIDARVFFFSSKILKKKIRVCKDVFFFFLIVFVTENLVSVSDNCDSFSFRCTFS